MPEIKQTEEKKDENPTEIKKLSLKELRELIYKRPQKIKPLKMQIKTRKDDIIF